MSSVIARERRRVVSRMLRDRREMEPVRFLESLTDPLFILARQAWLASRLVWPSAILSLSVLAILATVTLRAHQKVVNSAITGAVGHEAGEPYYHWSGYHRVDDFPSE